MKLQEFGVYFLEFLKNIIIILRLSFRLIWNDAVTNSDNGTIMTKYDAIIDFPESARTEVY